MKHLFSVLFLSSVILLSCGNSSNEKTAEESRLVSDAIRPVYTDTGTGAVIADYLNLKNALAADDSRGAATAGSELYRSLTTVEAGNLSDSQKVVMKDISADAKENAEHISKNAGNIKHQREHFRELSDEIYSFVKVFGSSETLYKDYCPMAKANWVSEVKEMENPYYGGEMPDCGEIKETINPQ